MTLDPNIIVILGVVVSIIAEIIKRYFSTNKLATLVVVLAMSIIAAVVYYFISQSAIFPTIIQILIIAGAFYAYLIRNILPPAEN